MKLRLACLLPLVAALSACNTPAPTNSTSSSAPASSARNTRATRASSGFDFYLLNLSWSPEFCSTHPSAPECAQHPALVLHGLWPQNADGTYPEHCSNAPGPADPQQYSDIYPDAGLLQHEWQTHGTCSGLAADAFFKAARIAFHSVTVPPQLAQLSHPTAMPPGQIINLVTASNPSIPAPAVAISCGNNYLTAIEVCLDKNLKPMSCPSVHTCGATSVRIPPP